MKLAPLLLCTAAAWAQSAPFLGQMIDAQSRLRPVYGMSGNFSLGAPLAEHVFAAACSQGACLAKTETALVSGPVSVAAPRGGAAIALDSSGATVYFAATRQFARWQSGTLTKLNLQVVGTVLSMAMSSSGLAIAVEREGDIWVIAADGTILDSLPPETTAVLLLPSSKIYATGDSLVLRKSDGSELRFPAPGVSSLNPISDGYVEASSESGLYALRVVPGHEQLFALPEGTGPR